MAIAALGYLPPVQGAVLQEAIDDIGVILNGLRALGDGRRSYDDVDRDQTRRSWDASSRACGSKDAMPFRLA
jgi:hypothetical protein